MRRISAIFIAMLLALAACQAPINKGPRVNDDGGVPSETTLFDGWKRVLNIPTTTALMSVLGRASDDIYAAGMNGDILHFDGTTWNVDLTGVGQPLMQLFEPPQKDYLFAVGWQGTLLYKNLLDPAATWQAEQTGTTEDLFGVWGMSNSTLWVVGGNGTVLFKSGGWHPVPVTFDETFSMYCNPAFDANPPDAAILADPCYSTCVGHGRDNPPTTCTRTETHAFSRNLYGIAGSGDNNWAAVGSLGASIQYLGNAQYRVVHPDAANDPARPHASDTFSSVHFVNGHYVATTFGGSDLVDNVNTPGAKVFVSGDGNGWTKSLFQPGLQLSNLAGSSNTLLLGGWEGFLADWQEGGEPVRVKIPSTIRFEAVWSQTEFDLAAGSGGEMWIRERETP